ncbi:uncharacterized protein EI97DRAFT_443120 [Westerdykella ornata]|uniref:Uncharacterized protein n=1 Tax=Westerdykella ornata TaxID=318751 RepID=A0A6A6JH22_WESOR|nr:uncharacterized protein EI97DRAFT_443120 [Westerdykella ornata]KAF2275702.1 hypothetical protein EI97DRAFT_443120 [Westerdykella ornata]
MSSGSALRCVTEDLPEGLELHLEHLRSCHEWWNVQSYSGREELKVSEASSSSPLPHIVWNNKTTTPPGRYKVTEFTTLLRMRRPSPSGIATAMAGASGMGEKLRFLRNLWKTITRSSLRPVSKKAPISLASLDSLAPVRHDITAAVAEAGRSYPRETEIPTIPLGDILPVRPASHGVPHRTPFDATEFYIVRTSGPAQGPASPEIARALEGWQYHNTCRCAAFVASHVLCQMLRGDPDIEKLRWHSFAVRKPFVLFPDIFLEKEFEPLTFLNHEVIVLYGQKGAYVMDLSGKQFGLPDLFFTLEEYAQYTIVDAPSCTRSPSRELEKQGIPLDFRFKEPASIDTYELAWLMQFALDACIHGHRIVRTESKTAQCGLLDLPPSERKLAHSQVTGLFELGMRKLKSSETFGEDLEDYRKWGRTFWPDILNQKVASRADELKEHGSGIVC